MNIGEIRMYSLIIILVMAILPLPIMVSTARKSGNAYKAVFEGVLSVGVALMMMFMMAASTGNPVGKVLLENVQTICQMAAESSQVASMLGMEDASAMERLTVLTKVYSYAINALPAVIIMCSTVLLYLEYRIMARMTKMAKNPLPMPAPLSEFTMNRMTVWGWVFIYLMSLGVTLMGFPAGDVLQVNTQLLFQFVFQIQGVAVIFFYCKMKKLNDIIPVLLCMFFMASALGQMLLCLLGFLDLGFGLRARIKKR